ncbi:DUF2934 domain-containing protein [Prosthecobacter sp.]|uniref:DUF2934 domain-containing protein n=1 Tax=Prosthecobacter sp. TaxID=1965333 RepID=UPI003783E396
MNSTPPHRPEHRYEEISLLAYHLWQKSGSPAGQDLEFWLQAEQQLSGKEKPRPAAEKKSAVPAKTKAKGKPAARNHASAATKRISAR